MTNIYNITNNKYDYKNSHLFFVVAVTTEMDYKPPLTYKKDGHRASNNNIPIVIP